MPLFLSALSFALVATQAGEAPRLRTILPNGVLVLVEKRPGAKDLIVDLFAASRGTEETPQTHGQRHLLEHIEALGVKGDLDTKLETAGGFLTARTFRDSMSFEMSLPPSGLALGLAAVKELVTGPGIDEAAISREANLIAEEGALRSSAELASSAAWSQAFGEGGLDPFGNLETLGSTKPDDLGKLRKTTFAANNLLVVVSGDVDLDATTKAVKDVVGLLPAVKPPREASASRPLGTGSAAVDGRGEYRATPVAGFRSPKTAAALAAALALASGMEHAEVIYTPSARNGLVLLGVSQGRMGDALDKAKPEELFETGRQLAARWVQGRLADPTQAAAFRGMLMVQAMDVRPETMLENLDSLTFADFAAAVAAFKSGSISVEGRS